MYKLVTAALIVVLTGCTSIKMGKVYESNMLSRSAGSDNAVAQTSMALREFVVSGGDDDQKKGLAIVDLSNGKEDAIMVAPSQLDAMKSDLAHLLTLNSPTTQTNMLAAFKKGYLATLRFNGDERVVFIRNGSVSFSLFDEDVKRVIDVIEQIQQTNI